MTMSCRSTATASKSSSSGGFEAKTRSYFRSFRPLSRSFVRPVPVENVKRMSRPGFLSRNPRASLGTNSTPSVRKKPRRISPSPLASRLSSSTPESSAASAASAVSRNCTPKRVSSVLRPVRSKSGSPSSFSSWFMAWLRLGWVMHSSSAARV